MNQFTDFFPQVLIVAVLLLGALAAAPLAAKARLPGPAAFLAVGIVAGLAGVAPVDHLSPLRLQEIGAIALYAILFQGGLATGLSAFRSNARAIVLLGLPGTLATAALLAAASHFVLRLDWSLAAIIGIALAPTDPAAVYAVLRGGGDSRARRILEGESGVNDPIGISLMVVAVEYISRDGSIGGGAGRLAQELGIGLLGGLAGAGLLLALLASVPRLDMGLQAGAMAIGALIVGSGTASLHGSGFLAVYISGLILSDRWAERRRPWHAIPEALSGIAEPLVFGLLGAAFAHLVGWDDLWRGLVITLITALIVRPIVAWPCLIGTDLTRRERLLVSWGGLKGAVPLLLAAYPALESIQSAQTSAAIVLVATAASVVVQGATLTLVAGPDTATPPDGP